MLSALKGIHRNTTTKNVAIVLNIANFDFAALLNKNAFSITIIAPNMAPHKKNDKSAPCQIPVKKTQRINFYMYVQFYFHLMEYKHIL